MSSRRRSGTAGLCGLVLALLVAVSPAHAAERTFESGSLIIPMDLAYQDSGIFQAYGLLFQLLKQGVRVYWVINQDKTWHAAACDTTGDECAWDCAIEGSGVKCPYPTAGPDFFAVSKVLWDSEGTATAGDPISNHGYRGGPFVIDALDKAAALVIIDAWNDKSTWGANPWATRTVFNVVSVHEATAQFTGWVRKEMLVAPTIAVFSDGNEDIATSYLRAAGIPQSNDSEFPASKCGASDCGPGTANPDMLTVPSVMGDMGTCDAVNYDHKNGALFTADGLPAYCQIMSMHWDVVKGREAVECDGGACPATQAECSGQTITYHGHEVVAEVRQFLNYPTHFFAECQAVNAYENTTPNPAWPYLDDAARNGHFLTTTGMPPPCPGGTCTDGDFECVTGGCNAGAVDCCLPKSNKDLGAGFLIPAQPDSNTLKILHPNVPYNQMDGAFATVGGSEPAYNLSTYLGTTYQNNREVTFITGPNGPGDQDVWMTGYLDGECDLVGGDDVAPPAGQCNGGKVSYLGGHKFSTKTPLAANEDAHGTRLFLNALFEADCVTSVGQPKIALSLQGDLVVGAKTLPAERVYSAAYLNQGRGFALDAVMNQVIPVGVEVASVADGGTTIVAGAEWSVGSISGNPANTGDPPFQGARGSTLRFTAYGEYEVELRMTYRVGQSVLNAPVQRFTIRVAEDRDGDEVPDDIDPAPDDPNSCGDSDGDTCDDCAVSGRKDPANDGPDADGDGICDAGEGRDGGSGGSGDGDQSGGCGCQSVSPMDAAPWLVLLLLFGVVRRRRRRS